MTSPDGTADYQPWFERWPGLKEEEQERFAAQGFDWAEDPAWIGKGYLAVNTEVEFRGKPLQITVVYPSEYPELPPTVFSNPSVLDRHQQLFRGNFCLLERPIDSWRSQSWRAADLITQQLLPLLSDTEAGPDTVRAQEAPMPEPASAFFGYGDNTVVLVPGNLTSVAGDGGQLQLRQFDAERFVLSKVDTEEADPPLLESLRLGEPINGVWKRIDAHPPEGPTGNEVLAWIRKEHAGLLARPASPPSPKDKRKQKRPRVPDHQFIGLVFPEERDAEGNTKDAWLFLHVQKGQGAALLHTQEVSEEQRQARIPDLDGLASKTALIIGVGSLGSAAALHLARAGVGHLKLVDFDRFEANNAVRHALGIDAAGISKVAAVGGACKRANPFCEIEVISMAIGATEGPPPLVELEQQVANADIIVDTTGVIQIELLLGRLAWESNTPLVSCWLTEGSWAGEIIRLIPGQTMCMTCFQTGQTEGTLRQGDAAEAEAMIAVQGCSHPTVSGAGFDAAETAAMAARLVVQTLLQSEAYPEPEWDHAVANFRRELDDDDFRRFETEALPLNEDCPQCRRDAG